jgi:serine/threonine protein kinase
MKISTDYQMEKYNEIKEIHSGSESADIFEVEDLDGKIIIKKQLKTGADEDQRKRFLNEISILKETKSEFIIRIIDSEIECEKPYYVMLQAKMTLGDYLKNNSGISELWIIEQIIQGIQALHHNKILHLDLNPKNVLVFIDGDGEKSIKISDLGLALHIDEVKKMNDNGGMPHGTLPYIPPRDINSIKNADFSNDIYNIGRISVRK